MRSSSVWLEAWLAFPPPNFSGDHQAFYGDIMISLREFPLWTQSSFGLSIHVRLIWKVDSPMILERAKEVSRAFLLLQQTFLTFSSTQLLWLSHFLNDCQILQLNICIRLISYFAIQAWMKNGCRFQRNLSSIKEIGKLQWKFRGYNFVFRVYFLKVLLGNKQPTSLFSCRIHSSCCRVHVYLLITMEHKALKQIEIGTKKKKKGKNTVFKKKNSNFFERNFDGARIS